MKKSLLILSYSDTSRDPRVLKQVNALKDMYQVTLAGFKDPQISGLGFICLGNAIPPRNILRKAKKLMHLILRRFKSFHLIEYGDDFSVFSNNFQNDFDFIIANDFSSLPLAISLKSPRSKLYLDAHEYIFDEFNNKFHKIIYSGYRNWLWDKHIEFVDCMTAVGDAIRDLYRMHSKCPEISVIKNVPPFLDITASSLEDGVINLVHHGSAIRGRGLTELVKFMDYLDERYILNLVLVPTDLKYLNKLKAEAAIDGRRVVFHAPVEVSQISEFISKFDLGIYLIPTQSLNNTFALPNKFFEFIQGRLGLIVGPAPEMARIVSNEGIGIVTSGYNFVDNAALLNNLSPLEILSFKENSEKVALQYSWNCEAKKLIDLF